MRRKSFLIAAGCILAGLGLFPLFSSGASPAVTEKVIYSFAGSSDGEYPSSDLTLDSEGNLYGTTTYGGEATCIYQHQTFPGCGTVFELKRTADGWTEQILYKFNFSGDGSGGALPTAGVIFDKAGNLYGTTEGLPDECGQGNVFELTPNTQGVWTETVLFRFPCSYGAPNSDLVFDSKGDLLGTTGSLVYELVPQANGSWVEVTLHTFDGAPDGSIPSSSVVLDSLGHVYGMTLYGGTGSCLPGCGIVYKLAPQSRVNWTETVLYNFIQGGGHAVYPSGGLILSNAGYLLGTSAAGGNGLGTVFKLTKSQANSVNQSVLYRFYGNPDGASPVGRVVEVADALFGVTSRGGTSGAGTVFGLKYSKASGWRERVLHSFAGGSDGSTPLAGVVSDAQGNLYGTTEYGGTGICNRGCGTVYEITP
jgi:uncharacterized repeat protein (TIGR03803 family)